MSRLNAVVKVATGVLVMALVVAGCGSSAPVKKKAEVLGGVTLTEAGTKLAFGQSASVSVKATPLRITVKGVTAVTAATLSRFGVAAIKPPVTPYFVTVTVTNLGTRNLGGSPIPLYLQDSKNVLVNYSPIKGNFAQCPSQTLPKSFAAQASVSTCLIYLLPATDSATLVSFRPVQTVDPITWTGPITGQSANPSSKASP